MALFYDYQTSYLNPKNSLVINLFVIDNPVFNIVITDPLPDRYNNIQGSSNTWSHTTWDLFRGSHRSSLEDIAITSYNQDKYKLTNQKTSINNASKHVKAAVKHQYQKNIKTMTKQHKNRY